jgi:hypothetical protein
MERMRETREEKGLENEKRMTVNSTVCLKEEE